MRASVCMSACVYWRVNNKNTPTDALLFYTRVNKQLFDIIHKYK